MSLRILIIDTETTGLKANAAVCEIAWIELNPSLEIVDRVYSLIDPQIPIEPSASGVHGITDKDVADAPTMQEFLDIVAGNPFDDGEIVVVAHNAAFDMKFVGSYIKNLAGTLCTLKVARRVYPEADDYKLQTLRYALGLDVQAADAHSATGDVEVCYTLLLRMMKDSGLDIEGLIELSNMPTVISKMPFGKHRGTKLVDLPADYIHWLLHKAEINDDLRAALVAL